MGFMSSDLKNKGKDDRSLSTTFKPTQFYVTDTHIKESLLPVQLNLGHYFVTFVILNKGKKKCI